LNGPSPEPTSTDPQSNATKLTSTRKLADSQCAGAADLRSVWQRLANVASADVDPSKSGNSLLVAFHNQNGYAEILSNLKEMVNSEQTKAFLNSGT
jgi:hypothetical protein